jgi:hypothetical protein
MVDLTTLQNLLAQLRVQGPLDASLVYFGHTDNLQPPYAIVEAYSHEWDRDTQVSPNIGGIRVSHFSLLIIGKNTDQAESYASKFNAILDANETLTPSCIRCLNDTWETGITDPVNLYQVGVRLTYTLFEDPNIAG